MAKVHIKIKTDKRNCRKLIISISMEIYERKSISKFVMILEKSSKDWSISGGFWSMVGKLQLQLYTGNTIILLKS